MPIEQGTKASNAAIHKIFIKLSSYQVNYKKCFGVRAAIGLPNLDTGVHDDITLVYLEVLSLICLLHQY